MQSQHAAPTTDDGTPFATFLIAALVVVAALAMTVSFGKPAAAAQGSVEGVVQIREGGVTSPFVGVDVQVLDGATLVATAVSGADGSYSVTVEEGTYTLRAVPPDSSGLAATQQTIVVKPDAVTRVDILFEVVESRVRVSGVVTGPDGEPVTGARVELLGPEPGDGGSTITDTAGAFVLQVLPRTYTRLQIDAGGVDERFSDRYLLNVRNLAITEAASFTVQLPTYDVTIETTDADTGDTVGAEISTFSTSSSGGPTVLGLPSEIRAALFSVYVPSGRIIVPLGPGSAQASASAPGYDDVTDLRFTPETTPTLTIKMAPVPEAGVTNFVGRVVDRNDDPVTGVEIRGQRAGTLGRTGLDGTFTVEDDSVLGNGTGFLQLLHFNYSAAQLPNFWQMGSDAVPHAAGATIDLGDIVVPTRLVEFSIVDPDGVPVPKAFFDEREFNTFTSRAPVTLSSYQGRGQSSYTNGILADDEGRLRMQLFDSAGPASRDSYTLGFAPPRRTDTCAFSNYVLQSTLWSFEVAGDTQITVVLDGPRCDRVAPPTAPVSGTLLVAGEAIGRSAFVGFDGVEGFVGTDTEPSGAFVADVLEGDNEMIVASEGDPGNEIWPVLRLRSVGSVVKVANTDPIDLGTFDVPLADLTVTVRTPDGRPIEGVDVSTVKSALPTVEFQMNGFAFTGTSEFPGSPTTGADGTATLPLLPGGSYDIRFEPPAGYEPLVRRGVQLLPQGNALLVQLTYPHAPPTATITVDGTSASAGVFDDRVTVSIEATAAPGFAPQSIAVSIDGGDPFPYTSPFEVSGGGEHTITAQVTDTGSVTGPPAIRTFEIVSNTDDDPESTPDQPDISTPDQPDTPAPSTSDTPTVPTIVAEPSDPTPPIGTSPDPTTETTSGPVGILPATGSDSPLAPAAVASLLGVALLALSRRPSPSRKATNP
jgi:hypothetical protein